jgi:hypothetical protein
MNTLFPQVVAKVYDQFCVEKKIEGTTLAAMQF